MVCASVTLCGSSSHPLLRAASRLSTPSSKVPPFPFPPYPTPLHLPATSPDLQYKLFIHSSGPEQGAQTARVQARSALILGMTCRPYYLSASLRHCHGQGLIHKAPGQRSRQKENVNPCPPRISTPYSGPHELFTGAPLHDKFTSQPY